MLQRLSALKGLVRGNMASKSSLEVKQFKTIKNLQYFSGKPNDKFPRSRMQLVMLSHTISCKKFDIFQPKLNLERIGSLFFVTKNVLHEMVFVFFWREILRQAILNFFAENVVRGNAVQIFSIFPPKVLVLKHVIFHSHVVL